MRGTHGLPDSFDTAVERGGPQPYPALMRRRSVRRLFVGLQVVLVVLFLGWLVADATEGDAYTPADCYADTGRPDCVDP